MAATETKTKKKKAPTLYAIIVVKLLKGVLFLALALFAYRLSSRDLPEEYRTLLFHLRVNPERRFWADLAIRVGNLTTTKVRWTAVGTFIYSLFSLVEGVGLLFRVPWAGWLTIAESAFFIPIEVFDLIHGHRPSPVVLVILPLNIFIVWYCFQNRARLFHH
jgi:uncharacterized membrane protein (DUF2068 family)